MLANHTAEFCDYTILHFLSFANDLAFYLPLDA